jgi:SAM-dependent methyltransferase/alkylhydroperoxidase family enzyme
MTAQWLTVDEGWGRRAVDFATLLEPAACREYVRVHHLLNVQADDRLLDVACGSGLALELAHGVGAKVAGIDASPRLVAIASDRVPDGDVRVGDMAALPWDDASFDVVTSFRGLWATTPEAIAEARRVLRPGGRIGVTTWGHVKMSPGLWALTPFTLAAPEKVNAQAQMKSLGRPEVGEAILAEAGFVGVRRHEVAFAWEFPDPETFARVLAATGPGYEAIAHVGEEEFHRFCVEAASERLRDGLPLRAEIACVALIAHVPAAPVNLLLADAVATPEVQALADDDIAALGFVTNATRLWMHDPALHDQLFDLIIGSGRATGLSVAERAVATIVAAAEVGDTYCPLAWGQKLAKETTPELAASVLGGSVDLLDDRGKALAAWALQVARDPQGVTNAELDGLVRVGFDDRQILNLTLFIALRIAFSTVNGALGARPEPAYAEYVDPVVRNEWVRSIER